MRGQSALEYLLIFSAVLIALTAVTLIMGPTSNAAEDSLQLAQARTAVVAIANAVDTVYCNGSGAVKSVSLQMDRTWTLQLDDAKKKIRITVEEYESGYHSAVYYSDQQPPLFPWVGNFTDGIGQTTVVENVIQIGVPVHVRDSRGAAQYSTTVQLGRR